MSSSRMAETADKDVNTDRNPGSAISDGLSKSRHAAAEAANQIADSTSEALSAVQDRAESAYRSATELSDRGYRKARAASYSAGRNVEAFFEENPIMVPVFSFVGGMVLGTLLPRTAREDRYLGEWRDELLHQGLAQARAVSTPARKRDKRKLGDFGD